MSKQQLPPTLLRKLRLELNWSQSDLASEVNTTQTIISVFESGVVLQRLANFFGRQPEELLERRPIRTRPKEAPKATYEDLPDTEDESVESDHLNSVLEAAVKREEQLNNQIIQEDDSQGSIADLANSPDAVKRQGTHDYSITRADLYQVVKK